MRSKIIPMLVMAVLFMNAVSAEFSSYTNVYAGTYNSTASYVQTIQTLIVGSDYDEQLKVANDGNVEAIIVYQVEDLGGVSWTNVNHLNVTCVKVDSSFNTNGVFYNQTTEIVHSELYTSANTPTSFIAISDEYGISDQMQCVYLLVYNVNTNITIDYPYAEETITPSYRTNFVELKIKDLELQQAANTVNVIQTYTNLIASWTTEFLGGIFEIWLIIFWIIKIFILYAAFALVILAIGFPVFLLIRFRTKVREWLKLEHGNEVR